MATRVTPESFAESVRWMDEELERAGRSRDDFTVSMHVPVFAWNGDDAWDRVRNSFNYVEYKYAHMLHARSMLPPSPAPPALTPKREQELLKEQPIIGPPEQVADRILAYRERAGVDFEFIARRRMK